MRARLDPAIRRWWDGGGGHAGGLLRRLALPAELLYRSGTRLRNRAFDAGLFPIRHAPVPVISVGNLEVGGTGKTPVSAWLVGELRRRGRRPALVARGYGADEMRLHRRWNPDVPVHAHADRVRASRAAAAGGADVVVLDDGFQHRHLGRDFDLVLLAAESAFPGRVLPRGPYREAPAALRRAHGVVVTRRVATAEEAAALTARLKADHPHLVVGTVRLAASGWADLHGGPADPPSGPVLAVSSVAAPERFERMVESATGTRPRSLAFPDHHEFSAADLGRIREAAGAAGAADAGGPATLVTTEKDAVKLARVAGDLPPSRVLVLAVEPGPGAAAVLERVLEAAGAPAGGSGRHTAPPASPQPGSP